MKQGWIWKSHFCRSVTIQRVYTVVNSGKTPCRNVVTKISLYWKTRETASVTDEIGIELLPQNYCNTMRKFIHEGKKNRNSWYACNTFLLNTSMIRDSCVYSVLRSSYTKQSRMREQCYKRMWYVFVLRVLLVLFTKPLDVFCCRYALQIPFPYSQLKAFSAQRYRE